MNRVLRLLLFAFLLGPLVGPIATVCHEEQQCATEDEAQTDCVVCTCCVTPAPGAPSRIALVVEGPKPEFSNALDAFLALQLRAHDILHVPRAA